MTGIVNLREIAEWLGVSRARADQLSRRASFPAPLTVSRPMRIWDREEVTAWITQYRPEAVPAAQQ
nr:AlpA family phage regulatory protein [Parafrankia discariae]